MKRAVAFLVLGPLLAATVAALVFAQIAGPAERGIATILAIVVFFFSLPVAALTGAFDAYLVRPLAILLRAPLTALCGAVIASGLAGVLSNGILPSSVLQFFALGGAVCAGACSLVANDYGGQQSVVQTNSLLRN